MDIILRDNSDKPLYTQIYEQISAQIVSETLKSGSSLPPIRTVASELKISVITVKKAWEELEKSGYIRTAVGSGCFVSDMHPTEIEGRRSDLVSARLKKDIEYCRSVGLTDTEIITEVKKLL